MLASGPYNPILLYRYFRLVKQQTADLPLFQWVQWLLIAVGATTAKLVAVSIAYHEAGVAPRVAAALRTMPVECLFVATGWFLTIAARRLPRLAPPWRGLVFALSALGTPLVLALSFINVEFYGSWAAPLSWDLLRLAPNLASYILMLGVRNTSGALTLGAGLALLSLAAMPLLFHALGPVLVRDGRWRRYAWLPAAVFAAGGLLAWARPPQDQRDETLRRLNVVSMLLPLRANEEVAAGAPSSKDAAELQALCGPPDADGAAALAPLRGRRLNVVLWVWESVGARHLRSMHPLLGSAATPELDRLMAGGSVQFSRAYAECPLTVQTTWAIITGTTPPARPYVFVQDQELPPHPPALQSQFSKAGYHTGLFYSSYTQMWRTRRIFDIFPFDVYEDGAVFSAMGRYAENGIGVQDEAPIERCLGWLDQQRRGGPFFAMLWNTETHTPYTWAGMPAAIAQKAAPARYAAAIERADTLLGRFYEELRRRGLVDSTLVIVVGDHGEGVGRPTRPWDNGHSGTVFEDETHVPLVFLHPSLKGATIGTLCAHVDLYPTLTDLLNLPTPEGLDGHSLARTYPARPLYLRTAQWWPLAIRAGSYKLSMTRPGGVIDLFDLQADPLESRDVKSTQPEITRLLSAALLSWTSMRFRQDGTFGYREPSMARLVNGPLRLPDWRQPTASATDPPRPPETAGPK
jgi:arylsulfatase A-like enzyme